MLHCQIRDKIFKYLPNYDYTKIISSIIVKEIKENNINQIGFLKKHTDTYFFNNIFLHFLEQFEFDSNKYIQFRNTFETSKIKTALLKVYDIQFLLFNV